MRRFIVRRLLWTVPTLFVISFLVFVALRTGTNPVQSYLRINPRASQAKIQQYVNWGRSIKGSRPVWPELRAAMGNTLLLGVLSSIERRILVRHALRNALIPIVTVAALNIGSIIGGLIVTERIFENRGMGDFFLTAYSNGDFPQLMPYMIFVVPGVVLANLLADVLYAALDPRIRLD
jgi:ABC-type dipeptide/oligopeptide/nickel transport system permease component